jgi:hypothetical protein
MKVLRVSGAARERLANLPVAQNEMSSSGTVPR